MKLKDLMEKYGEYELYTDSPKHIEDAFKNFGSKDDGVLCLYVKKPKPKTVWDLGRGDSHVFVGDCGAIREYGDWLNCLAEKKVRDIGNAFLTEEEAEKDVERKKVEALLLKHGGRRWFKENSENFYIYYDMDVIDCTNTYDFHYQGTIYFDTEEQAEKAIAEIGEERIKKALFEVR